jgi:hypothetical protein
MSAPKDVSLRAMAAPMPRLKLVTVQMFSYTFYNNPGKETELAKSDFAKQWLILSHCDGSFCVH